LSGQWQQPGAGQPPSGTWAQPAGGQPPGGWQGQQQAHAPQAHQPGGVHLRTGFFPLAFILYLFPPKCSVDGSPEFALRWGDNHLPVPAGRHHIRVWFPYLFISQCGPAETVVDVPESGMPLEYKAPTWWVFSKGKMLIPGYGPAPAAPVPVQQGYGAQPQVASTTGGAWHPDPTGRYEQRYWDGQGWTAHVARGGVQASDPI
jgi:Protein of unknown function (DUF2510)